MSFLAGQNPTGGFMSRSSRQKAEKSRKTMKRNTKNKWKRIKQDFNETVTDVKNSRPDKFTSKTRLKKSEFVLGGYIFDKTSSYLVIGYMVIFFGFALYLILSGALGGGTRSESMNSRAWNDTKTIGMTGEYTGNVGVSQEEMEMKTNTTVSDSTPAPSGMPATSPKYCTTPTGFLMRMVQAHTRGMKEGIVTIDGINIDMGSDGAFYDRWGDGCCDAYCRIVSNGNYWSCVDPQTRTSQYLQSLPRGRKCEKYGNNHNEFN